MTAGGRRPLANVGLHLHIPSDAFISWTNVTIFLNVNVQLLSMQVPYNFLSLYYNGGKLSLWDYSQGNQNLRGGIGF